MTQIVNFFAGPGAGKSTVATGVFAEMKKRNINCEYVAEYAKELAWKEDKLGLQDQFHVFGEQHFRLSSMVGKVDFLLCDSPLILGLLYAPKHYPPDFHSTVWWAFNQYNNVNFFVNRRGTFNPAGRVHNLKQSKQKDEEIKMLLKFGMLTYTEIATDEDHVTPVLKVLGIDD